jgi:hypothetical protein
MPLHLRTLLMITPSNIIDNSMRVRLTGEKAEVDADANGTHKLYTCFAKDMESARPEDGPWRVIIRLYSKEPKGNMGANHPAWVHCDCPYFQYYVEVANAARRSSSVITSNGHYPKIRNPRMKPYLCKHLVKAFRRALRMKPVAKKIHKLTDRDIELALKMVSSRIPTTKAPKPSRRLPRRVGGR